MAWNLKARMVAVEENVETFEQAFLAHLLDPRSGRTIYEHLAEDGHVELPAPLLALPSPEHLAPENDGEGVGVSEEMAPEFYYRTVIVIRTDSGKRMDIYISQDGEKPASVR